MYVPALVGNCLPPCSSAIRGFERRLGLGKNQQIRTRRETSSLQAPCSAPSCAPLSGLLVGNHCQYVRALAANPCAIPSPLVALRTEACAVTNVTERPGPGEFLDDTIVVRVL